MSVLRQRTSQRSKKLWIAGGIGALATGVLSIGIFAYSYHYVKQQEAATAKQYEKMIGEEKSALDKEQQSKHKAYVVKKDMEAGTKITAADLVEVDIPKSAVPDNVVDDNKYPVGKYTKIAIRKNTPLVKTMFYEDGITPPDERYQEFNVIKLPSDLKQDQYVDVRIKFANAQDFIVLSKKKVAKIQGNSVFFQMDEKEIVTMASAIIDAFLHKATIYAVTYVDPTVQDRSVVDYPVREQVQTLIQTDPNILEQAKESLADRLRVHLDANLKALSPGDEATAAADKMPDGAPIGLENQTPAGQQDSKPDTPPSGNNGQAKSPSTPPVANGSPQASNSSATTDSNKSTQKSIFDTNINNAVSP